jgi:hypothetical protein
MGHVGKYVDWRLILTAPFEEDVELFGADVDGSLYRLRHPCRRTAEGAPHRHADEVEAIQSPAIAI